MYKAGLGPLDIKVADVSGTSKTISANDNNYTMFFTELDDITITLPDDITSVVHASVVKLSSDAYTINFVTSGTATLEAKNSANTLVIEKGGATIIHRGNGKWYLFGDVE